MLDQKTVRLVIIVGIYFVVTGDYGSMITTMWNNSQDRSQSGENSTKISKSISSESSKDDAQLDPFALDTLKTEIDEENGTDQ